MANQVMIDGLGSQLPVELANRMKEQVEPSSFTDSSGTPGNCTAHTYSGVATIASGTKTVVITNRLVGTKSCPIVVFGSNDATAIRLKAVCTAGTLTITTNENATADCLVYWAIAQ